MRSLKNDSKVKSQYIMFSLFLYKTMRCLFDIKKCDFYKKFRFLTGSVIFVYYCFLKINLIIELILATLFTFHKTDSKNAKSILNARFNLFPELSFFEISSWGKNLKVAR